MESTLYSAGVYNTSFRATSAPRGVGASTDFCTDFTAHKPQSLNWKSPRGSAGSSLSSCSRVQFSRDIIVNSKSFRKLPKKRFRASETLGKSGTIRATMTTDESTETVKEPKIITDEPTEAEKEPEIEDRLPEQAVLSQHPWDPHKPNYSKLIPEALRPYPSFEGWFVRLWDPESNFSAAVILATNYATEESQVSLLFTPCKEDLGTKNAGAVRREEDGKYVLRTYAVAEMSKDATFVDIPRNNVSEDHKPLNSEPVGFEWKAPGLGMIKTTAEETEIDVTIMGYSLQVHLTNNKLWDADQSERGPEGWARILPVPTHWYVYSLGSTAEFNFSGPDGVLARSGTAWAHQEKNWGLTFPSGHVWFQGFSSDNTAQVLGSAAYYKLGESVRTPYLISMGYRSPEINIDMRTNDVGTVFKDIAISPLTGEFGVEGVSLSHSIFIRAKADPQSLSEAILAPIGKTHWESACRETFLAVVDVEVYEHAVWGIAGGGKLVSKTTFNWAGLEFGEDLLKAAAEKQDQNDQDEQIERSRAIDS